MGFFGLLVVSNAFLHVLGCSSPCGPLSFPIAEILPAALKCLPGLYRNENWGSTQKALGIDCVVGVCTGDAQKFLNCNKLMLLDCFS